MFGARVLPLVHFGGALGSLKLAFVHSFIRFYQPLGEACFDTEQSFRINFTYRAKQGFSIYYRKPPNPNDAIYF